MVETAYALYLGITIGITIWVARTLSKNGEVFFYRPVDFPDRRNVFIRTLFGPLGCFFSCL